MTMDARTARYLHASCTARYGRRALGDASTTTTPGSPSSTTPSACHTGIAVIGGVFLGASLAVLFELHKVMR
jgi:hypothetical protein